MKTGTLIFVCTSLMLGLSNSALADNYKHKKAKLAAELNGGQQVRTAQIMGATGETVTIPIGPLVTGAHGKARFKLSKDKTMLEYHLEATGFGTPLFMAHIHLGPKGANGGVLMWLFGDQSNAPFTLPRDDGPFTGAISGTLTMNELNPNPALGINTFEDAITNIMNGNAYVNLHTTANPPGEIRGQIHPKH